jgi:hypothetical protein
MSILHGVRALDGYYKLKTYVVVKILFFLLEMQYCLFGFLNIELLGIFLLNTCP